MVWCVIDVCIKNRTLHDHLEICNFSSHIEKYFSMLEEKFHLTAWPCNIIYVFQIKCFIKQVISYFWSVPTCIQLIEDLAIVFITHLDLSLKGIPFAVVNSQAAKFTGEFFWRGRGYIWLRDFGGFWFYLHYLTFTFNLVTRSHPGLHWKVGQGRSGTMGQDYQFWYTPVIRNLRESHQGISPA